jgi:hypothetical protein
MITDIKEFTSTFNRIAISKSEDSVFQDFLDICICALSLGKYEEEYLAIVNRYRKEEVNLFCELFAQMVIVMDNDGAGFTDCLGEFFTTSISRGRNGQFFTPHHVCDMMAAMTINSEDSGKTVFDPCCGSGRMLLSAAKIARNNYFFGADIDTRCAKMTAINMCLNGLLGEVAWMDSLGMKHWGGYSIHYAHACTRVPIITKLSANEGIICKRTPFNKADEVSPSPATTDSKIINATQGKLDFE